MAPWRPSTRSTLVVLLLILAAPGAGAGSGLTKTDRPELLKKLSLEQLLDLEVTSVSQKPESLFKAAAAIHVVTPGDLREMGALSIPEALRAIPGIEVARVDARQYAITARGFNGTTANKLLVLIDGRSVYTPLYSGVFWDVQDTFLEDIEQIEVIRGPGATVWGANAVNGVINVRTRSAAETQGWLVDGGGGTAETDFAGARYGGTLGADVSYRLYGKHFNRAASLRSDGHDAGDDYWMTQGGLRLDWQPAGKNAFTLQGDAYTGSERQPATPANELKGVNAVAQWMRRLSSTSDLQVFGYFDHTERDATPIFGETLNTYDLEVRHRWALSAAQDVVWGVEYRLMDDDVRNSQFLAFLPAKMTRRQYSFFVQDELKLADDRLHVTLGSKVEHNAYTGYEVQPGVRLGWAPRNNHLLWGSVSRAVRTPSRIDRDFFVPASPPYLLVGGNFDSEVLNAFEAGYRFRGARAVNGSVSAFYNLYDDLRSVEPGPPFFIANGLEGHTHGLETEVGCQVAPPWRLSAGYSYLKIDVEPKPGSTDVTSEAQEGDSPRHQTFLRSSLSMTGDLKLDFTMRYVGHLPRQQVPAYGTGDVHCGWQATKHLGFDVVGRDLFAPRHAEFGMPTTRHEIPRSVYGKLTCRL